MTHSVEIDAALDRLAVPSFIRPALMGLLAQAWDEGNRHEAEYLDTWGQFDPNPVNPYREGVTP